MTKLLFILWLLTAWSCSPSYQKCKSLYGGDSLVTYKDSTFYVYDTIYVKGDTMGGEVSLEDLLTNEYVKDSVRQTVVIKYRDGKIKYVNICKPQMIHEIDTVMVRITEYISNNFKDQSVAQKIYASVKWWWWVILAAMIFSVGYLINASKK